MPVLGQYPGARVHPAEGVRTLAAGDETMWSTEAEGDGGAAPPPSPPKSWKHEVGVDELAR